MNFTVVIPCFNSSDTIGRALDSLATQTYTNFDVVIVDDASSDYLELLTVIDLYNERLSINIIRNEINKNGSFSRNRGVAAARGNYVAFLDADDSWVSTRLEYAASLISRVKEKDFVSYGRFELLQNHSTGAVLPLRGIRPGELVSEYVFAAGQHMQTSTFICPTETAKKIMFDETLTRHQDSDFMMRAQSAGVLIVYNDVKCSHYHTKVADVKNRIVSGRVNSDFCINWMSKKHDLLNRRASAGYRLQVYARVMFLEGSVFSSIKLAILSVTKVGCSNILDLLKVKFLIFYKSNLGL